MVTLTRIQSIETSLSVLNAPGKYISPLVMWKHGLSEGDFIQNHNLDVQGYMTPAGYRFYRFWRQTVSPLVYCQQFEAPIENGHIEISIYSGPIFPWNMVMFPQFFDVFWFTKG